jgi:hypothetical protein
MILSTKEPKGVDKHGNRTGNPPHEPDAATASGRSVPGGIHGDIGTVQTSNRRKGKCLKTRSGKLEKPSAG